MTGECGDGCEGTCCERSDVTCCDFACYEDEGCGCDGCRENGLGWWTSAGHLPGWHDSSLRCRIAVALYGLTRAIGRLADRIDPL